MYIVQLGYLVYIYRVHGRWEYLNSTNDTSILPQTKPEKEGTNNMP